MNWSTRQCNYCIYLLHAFITTWILRATSHYQKICIEMPSWFLAIGINSTKLWYRPGCKLIDVRQIKSSIHFISKLMPPQHCIGAHFYQYIFRRSQRNSLRFFFNTSAYIYITILSMEVEKFLCIGPKCINFKLKIFFNFFVISA